MRDPAPPRLSAVSAVLVAVMGLELVHLFAHLDWARTAAHVAMLVLVPVAWRRIGFREYYLLTFCAVLAGLVWQLHPEPMRAIRAGFDQAVFLMAFILLISLVQEGAMTSRSVALAGDWLARRPGSQRFLSLYGGTNVMAVIFNLGTVSLIAPLIRRAAEEAPDDPLTPIRERRQLNATLRGFAWAVVWSPTAVAPLALMELIDGIDRGRWIVLGLGLAVLMMLIGWAEDWLRWRGFTASRMGLPPPYRPPFPGRAVLRFGAVCVTFAGLTLGIMETTGQGIPASLVAASPILMILWLLAQNGGQAAPALARVGAIVRESLPLSAAASVTLACSGFIGRAGAELIPAEQLADWVGLDQIPAWIFLTGTAVAVALLSQLALSPIMMAVFFGSVLGALPSLPADPTLTALAISTGWSLSMTCAPFASVVILLTRLTGKPGTVLTYRWNTGFSFAAVIALAVCYWTLTHV